MNGLRSASGIRGSFSPTTWARGVEYQRRGRATILAVEPDGSGFSGRVVGGGRIPYTTDVRLIMSRDGRVEAVSTCSCPVGLQCKHAAALMEQARVGGLLLRAAAAAEPQVPSDVGGRGPALPTEVELWLADLEAAASAGEEDFPPEVRQRLVYIVDLREDAGGASVATVRPLSVRLLKDGGYSRSATDYSPANIDQGGARFLRPSDRAVLRLLRTVRSGGLGGIPLAGESGTDALARVLATGRCHWRSLDGPPAEEGPTRDGRIAWQVSGDGRQRPVLTLEDAVPGETVAVLPMSPPWYVSEPGDGAPARLGRVSTGLPPRIAEALLAAPPVPPDGIPAVRARIAAAAPAARDALPAELPPARRIAVAPTPVLRISAERFELTATAVYARRWSPGSPSELVGVLRLSFDYGGFDIPAGERSVSATRMSDEGPVVVQRWPTEEAAALRRLVALGAEPLSHRTDLRVPQARRQDFGLRGTDHDDGWTTFLFEGVPELEAEGWRVAYDPSFPIRPLRASGEGAGIDVAGAGSGIDWFELSVGVPVGDERVDVLPALLEVLDRLPVAAAEDMLDDDAHDDAEIRLPVGGGRVLALPYGRLRPILRALLRILGREGVADRDRRITALDAADLAAAGEDGVPLSWGDAEAPRRLAALLRAGPPGPAAVPVGFAGGLRPYQRDGLAWLQALREAGVGGVLADDMGLGKTVQALAHVVAEKEAGRLDRPCLVVAPTSLMANWRGEAAAFAPGLSTLVLQGPGRAARFGDIARHDLVLTTYPLLAHDGDVLAAQPWHVLLLDEAQAVRNPATTAAKTLRRIQARQRIALTGTPVENSLGDLWALYDLVAPGLLGDRKSFAKRWRTPIEKQGDADRQRTLSRRLRPFLLRRTKAQVASDLPPKTEIVERVELLPEQRKAYEGVRLTMHRKVLDAIARRGLARSRIQILEALLRLRQICCDPRLVASLGARGAAAGSAKLARLMEMLPGMLQEGRRVLLFSQFATMLDLIGRGLDDAGIPFALLTGKTTDRETPVRAFQDGALPLFLISLKAGGTGLNLTAADTVIHYDPWWNPAVEAQATDRAHRIGQDKPVFVYRLVAEDTIEGKMQVLKDRKRALADGLFDPDGATPFDIDEDDVAFLLGA